MVVSVRDLLAPGSADSARSVLAENVVFRSPVRSYTGGPDVAHLLATIGRCLSAVEPRREFGEGERRVTEFVARVDDQDIEGVLAVSTGADGLVSEATLLLRPLSVLQDAIAHMVEMLTIDPLPSDRVA
jgi:hypothetical protein